MVLQRQIRSIRDRWHPLWRLRKWPFYRYIQEKIDFTSYVSIPETGGKIAIRFLRDFSWIANPINFEPEIRDTFKLVLSLLAPKVFWDIGANIGFYSWLVNQSSSIEKLVLFEPDPVNYALLQSTVRKNNIQNCTLWNVAVSNAVGEIKFIIDEASGATGSIESTAHIHNQQALHFHYGMGKSITCQTVTVDSLLDKSPLPDFIKIDVEGAEHLVVEGAINCLKRHRPTLIMETTNYDLIRKLYSLAYTVYQIDEGNFLFVSNQAVGANNALKNRLKEYNVQ